MILFYFYSSNNYVLFYKIKGDDPWIEPKSLIALLKSAP